MTVNASFPAKIGAEFIAYAKASKLRDGTLELSHSEIVERVARSFPYRTKLTEMRPFLHFR